MYRTQSDKLCYKCTLGGGVSQNNGIDNIVHKCLENGAQLTVGQVLPCVHYWLSSVDCTTCVLSLW